MQMLSFRHQSVNQFGEGDPHLTSCPVVGWAAVISFRRLANNAILADVRDYALYGDSRERSATKGIATHKFSGFPQGQASSGAKAGIIDSSEILVVK
jgi:hypothetical protein